jgi:hypothetical protein
MLEKITAWSTLGLAIGTVALAVLAYVTAVIARNSLRTARTTLERQSKDAADSLRAAQQAIERQSADAIYANAYTRAEATLTYIDHWRTTSTQQWDELKKYVASKGWKLPVALLEHSGDQEFRLTVRPILEGVEHLALGVRFNAYDLDIVHQMARNLLTTLYNDFLPYIEQARKGWPGRGGQPNAYEHFEWIVERLRDLDQRPDVPVRGRLPG